MHELLFRSLPLSVVVASRSCCWRIGLKCYLASCLSSVRFRVILAINRCHHEPYCPTTVCVAAIYLYICFPLLPLVGRLPTTAGCYADAYAIPSGFCIDLVACRSLAWFFCRVWIRRHPCEMNFALFGDGVSLTSNSKSRESVQVTGELGDVNIQFIESVSDILDFRMQSFVKSFVPIGTIILVFPNRYSRSRAFT